MTDIFNRTAWNELEDELHYEVRRGFNPINDFSIRDNCVELHKTIPGSTKCYNCTELVDCQETWQSGDWEVEE